MRKRAKTDGFSLIETAIAVGIVSVALSVFVGLIGTGLRESGEGSNRFAASRIFQGLAGEYQMMNWDAVEAIPASVPQDRYFDYQGHEVAKDSSEKVYAVRVKVENDFQVPGAASPAGGSRRVTMEFSDKAFLATPFQQTGGIRMKRSLSLVQLGK